MIFAEREYYQQIMKDTELKIAEPKLIEFSDRVIKLLEDFDDPNEVKILMKVASLKRSMVLATGVPQSEKAVNKQWNEFYEQDIKYSSRRVVGGTILIAGIADELGL